MSKLSNKSLVLSALLLKIGGWRAPIFMVDRIADFTFGNKEKIVVAKGVTFNEPYIAGHFPDHPIMPGVMIAEIFGQTSEYLTLLSDFIKAHNEKNDDVPLKKADDIPLALKKKENIDLLLHLRDGMHGYLVSQNLKFRHVVYPGQTIYASSSLAFADSNGFHHYNVEAWVERNIVCSGQIVNLRVAKNKISGDEKILFTYLAEQKEDNIRTVRD